MLNLDQRACKLGGRINNRSENHGDKKLAAFDVPITDVMLTEHELAEVLGIANAGMFFTLEDPPKPAIPMLAHLPVGEDFESAQVVLAFALSGETIVTLTDCTLAGMQLEPMVGGLTRAKFAVQCKPVIDADWDELYLHLGGELRIAIGDAKHPAQQGKLALNAPRVHLASGAQERPSYEFDASSGCYGTHIDDAGRIVTNGSFPPLDERRYVQLTSGAKVSTEAEDRAGVTVVDANYPPGDARRYGAVGDGNDTDEEAAE